MGDIVNLGAARKAKARTLAGQAAAENRARFGRTKAQKAADAREEAARTRVVDAAKLDRPADT